MYFKISKSPSHLLLLLTDLFLKKKGGKVSTTFLFSRRQVSHCVKFEFIVYEKHISE